jgi:hypothetical protein
MAILSHVDIMKNYTPSPLEIGDLNLLVSAIGRTNFLIYGEIHGIKENADIVYTLARNLGIKRIAIENDPSIKGFIDAAARGIFDFSLIDTDTFDTSILSIEMAGAISYLLREGHVEEIVYIDTFFADDSRWDADDPDSPQKREQDLADNILALDASVPTLCLLGQWHTQLQPVSLQDDNGNKRGVHLSALYRCRLIKPDLAFVHVLYGKGELYNDGRTLSLPVLNDIPAEYTVRKLSDSNFDLFVPCAHKISLPNIVTKL